jgi:general secretion pathway protein G
MVVLTVIAILLSIATPMYFQSVVKAKEAALLENLHEMRSAIDKYYADHGEYPATLSALVEKRYIRAIPIDPFTESRDTWAEVRAEEGGVYDVRSGSAEIGRNAVAYNEW